MVNLEVVRSANATLVANQPLVAVFVGGTSGIGAFSIRSLAETHGKGGKGLRAYIVGRNAEAAQRIISDCQKVCPTGQFRFVRAKDLALLKDVDRVCAELIQNEEKEASTTGATPRIDILVMTQAIFEPFGSGRKETTEGIDTFMSLLYYSRMRFTTLLLPLLLSSSLPAHVISVFGPQRDTTLIPDDLSLRDPKNYSFMTSGSHAAYLTTFFMEHLAAQNPGKLALIHYFPGLVITEGFDDPSLPRWFRWTFKYGAPLIKPFTVNGTECGQRVLFNASPRFPARSTDIKATSAETDGKVGVALSSDGIVGGGAYKVNWNGELIKTGTQYGKLREEKWDAKVLNHTLTAFEEIAAGKVFTG